MAQRSSGGAKDAKAVYRIVWVEEHEHGTYTKSTKVYSEGAKDRQVRHLENRLKKKDADPNDSRWRWHRPVVSYTVDECPLEWKRIKEVTV